MPNSSYSIYAANDGSGNFTPTARRNPTAASGGTTLTLPASELFAGTTQTSTKLLYLAIDAAKRRILDDYTQTAAATRSSMLAAVGTVGAYTDPGMSLP